jgi:molybdopterin-guanine dinucleotide biosynthesis adapter protein
VSTAKAMQIFGLAGWSGSGKTTLVTRLVPELTRHNLTVSTMKHAHHSFDLDQPGKDSWRHRQAGASEVMIASERRWALIHEHRGAPEPTLESLIRQMTPVDLLLVEGWKRGNHPKLEVHRPALGKPLLCRDDPHIVAVASDAPVSGLALPLFALDDVAAIAGFILQQCRLKVA